MYQVKCKICGKDFEVVNSRYCYCSPECSKEGFKLKHKECEDRMRNDEFRWEAKKKKHKIRARIQSNGNVKCIICGQPVYRSINSERISRDKMHAECVVKEAVEILRSGQKMPDKVRLRAYSRGYDIGMLKEIMETGVQF